MSESDIVMSSTQASPKSDNREVAFIERHWACLLGALNTELQFDNTVGLLKYLTDMEGMLCSLTFGSDPHLNTRIMFDGVRSYLRGCDDARERTRCVHVVLVSLLEETLKIYLCGLWELILAVGRPEQVHLSS